MRLLDRYLFRELLGPLAYCLGGFLLFWISFDLFTTLAKIQEKHLTTAEAAQYYMVKTPELLVLVLPISLLLALLYTLTHLAKSHELTAIRAAGWSLWRLSFPFFLVGLACSGIVFALNELVVPGSLEAGEEIFNRHATTESGSGPSLWKLNLHFRNARDKRIWNIGAFNLQTFEMINPQLEWLLPNGTNLHLMAKRAARVNKVWTFFDVQQNAYGPLDRTNFEFSPSVTNRMAFPELSETPEDIKILNKFNEMNSLDAAKKPQLSIGEIRYLRSHLQLNKRDQYLLNTSLQYRLATPWTCLVVVLIALPFGAASHRRNVFVGVASSILICFVFFILMRVGLALGTSGRLPGWLAAWLPNVVFGVTGLIFTQRIR